MAALRPRTSGDLSAHEAGSIAHAHSVGTSNNVRVVVCSRQPPIRRGIAECLRRDGFVVDEAAAISGAAAALGLHAIQLVVIDSAMFDTATADGFTVPRPSKVVVIADSGGPGDVVTALDRGAAGYLLTNIDGPALVRACRAVLNGREAIDETLMAALAPQAELMRRGRRIVGSDGGPVVLSPREYEVASRLREGFPTRVIADQLGISAVTVRRHISATMEKAGVGSRASLRRVLSTSL